MLEYAEREDVNMPIKSVATKTSSMCLGYVCWNCMYTWISDVAIGEGVRCPCCNGADVSCRPLDRRNILVFEF